MTTNRLRSIARRRALLLTLGIVAATAAPAAATNHAPSAQVQGSTLVVVGTNGPDNLALRLAPGAPTTLQVDVGDDGAAEASFDRGTFDRILVHARRGDDRVRIDDANGAFTDTEITTISGGRDDDTLLGGRGAETFFAGAGNDTVDGNQGNDLALMGWGDDTFIWDPGDGSDTIEGQAGWDTMDFRGAAAAEVFDMSANGGRLRFFRDLGNIVMDTDDVERVTLEALGGTDTTTVNDLRATDVRDVRIDLAPALGATGGDTLADAIVVNATAGNDDIAIRPKDGRVVVEGLAPRVTIANTDATADTLTVNALGGDDTVRFGAGLGKLIRALVNA